MDKQRIQARFGHAAHEYDDYAHIQKTAAQHLAERIHARWPELQRVLELGCGTGNLTHRLLRAYPGAQLHATDLAPDMLQSLPGHLLGRPTGTHTVQHAGCRNRQRARLRPGRLQPGLPMAGQALAVCSRLHSQGARLAIATLIDGTFAEWKAAHQALGLSDGVLPFLGEGCLQRWAHKHGATLHIETLTESYPQAIDFVSRDQTHRGPYAARRPSPSPTGQVLRQFRMGSRCRIAWLTSWSNPFDLMPGRANQEWNSTPAPVLDTEPESAPRLIVLGKGPAIRTHPAMHLGFQPNPGGSLIQQARRE